MTRYAAALTCAALALADTAPAADRSARGVSDASLAAAAREAPLSALGDERYACRKDLRVAEWLTSVVGDTSSTIRWRGGRCLLTNTLNPIDAGSRWCGGATVTPKATPQQPARIEIYFEEPADSKPGRPYAFRAEVYTRDGADYERMPFDFETAYRARYRADAAAPEHCDDDGADS